MCVLCVVCIFRVYLYARSILSGQNSTQLAEWIGHAINTIPYICDRIVGYRVVAIAVLIDFVLLLFSQTNQGDKRQVSIRIS